MSLDLLIAKYFQLRQELDIAYRRNPWLASRIDWLADELAAVERNIASIRARRE
ncbi:MAG: hypothetical protein ABI887_08070 [Burkholderiales bacterium]